MSIIAELKRRNVFKVAVAYAIVAWLLIQVADVVLPTFEAPGWVMQVFTFFIIIGFPLALFFAWAYELTPDGIRKTRSVPLEESITGMTGQKLNYIVTGLLVLAVVFLVIDNYVLEDKESEERGVRYEEGNGDVEISGEPQPSETAGPPALAVLPFADMSPNKDQEYFSDGLSEELLNKLAQLDGLLVAGRTSSFAFKGRNEDLRVIGETLDCGYILEGSVRKAADTVRITAQLINAADGYHLWSDTYDRELTDIFAVQDEIAEAVATALSITLGVGELGRTAGGTRNLAAYEEFLQAQHQLNTNPDLGDVFLRIISHLRRAVELDPQYVNALVDLYEAHRVAPTWTDADTGESQANAAAALERARSLTPDAPNVLRAIANQHQSRGEWLQAERLYRQALASSSDSDVDLLLAFAVFSNQTGRAGEALGYYQQVFRLDPLNGSPGLGLTYTIQGRFDEAFAEYERAIERQKINPTLPNAVKFLNHSDALVAAWATRDEQLIDAWDRRAREAGWGGMADAGNIPEESLKALKENYTVTGSKLSKLVTSIWASYLGDQEFALQVLQDAFDGDHTYAQMIWRPITKDVRLLPGFKELVADLGLVDYWRASGNWGDFCRPVGEDDFECE